MKVVFSFLLFVFLFQQNVLAQDGFNLTLNLSSSKASKIILSYYNGNAHKLIKIDSAYTIEGKQIIEFKRKTNIYGGFYHLKWIGIDDLDIIINNGDEIAIAIDSANFSQIKFLNSQENADYYNANNVAYSEKNNAFNEFKLKYPQSIATQMLNLKTEIHGYQKGMNKSAFRNQLFTKKYLQDNRLMITPILDSALLYYMIQTSAKPDSFNVAADHILSQLNCGEPMFKYMFKWFANYLTQHSSNGMDESLPFLVKKYITNSTCNFLDFTTKTNLITEANAVTMLLNKPCPALALKDTNGVVQDIKNIYSKADYTLLAFFDVDCKHCQIRMPEMDKMADSLSKKYNVTISRMSVLNAHATPEQWKEFFKKYPLNTSWIHTADFENNATFKNDFDVYSNPNFFIINKQGIIIGKKVTSSGFAKCIKDDL